MAQLWRFTPMHTICQEAIELSKSFIKRLLNCLTILHSRISLFIAEHLPCK